MWKVECSGYFLIHKGRGQFLNNKIMLKVKKCLAAKFNLLSTYIIWA